jgi:hypothetical protein
MQHVAMVTAGFYKIAGKLSIPPEDAMDPINLRIPRERAPDFTDDLTAWTSTTGIDPCLTIVNESSMTTNLSSATLYQVFVSEGFFEQFPEWRVYVER